MIGPLGLILHMTGAAVVSLGVGLYYGAVIAGKGLQQHAHSRGLDHELELIVESDAKHGLRMHEAQKASAWFNDYLGRERNK